MTCGFYGMQAIYEGVVFSHMTHLNRMRERFTDVCALRVTGGPAHSDVWMQMLADVSGLRIELPQVEETGCFGAALAARVGTGVYRDFREAQRDLQHPVRTLLPDMTAHALYQRKYRQYQDLIEALLRAITPVLRSTHYEPTITATGARPHQSGSSPTRCRPATGSCRYR